MNEVPPVTPLNPSYPNEPMFDSETPPSNFPLQTPNLAPAHNPFAANRNRNDSLISVDTVYMPDEFQTNNFTRQRNNSDLSIASSVFSEVQRPQLDAYNFSSTFDDQLFSYYISYSQQPNITPFDIRFPPSGILSRISKLFLENCILPTNMQIDISSPEINAELLNPQNRHNLLAIIRLRLIHMCNIKLNANYNDLPENSGYNDLLPMSRSNSVVSGMSFNDKVTPNLEYFTQQQQQQQQQQSLQSKNSWLNINPNIYSNRFNRSNLNSTDSLDRIDDQTPLTLTAKRERPTLNLHLPPISSATCFKQPIRPSFNIGQSPLTPGTPNTPSTPNGSFTNLHQRNNYPRAARSASLTNAGPTYFNLPPPSTAPSSSSTSTTYLNPVLNGIDTQSPFEQAFPSPMFPQHSHLTQQSSLDQSPDLFNATVSRKRDSLKLKRAP
ncbi:hypothetical protein CANINC_001514 [Pichia inconspicua]|uniref:Uncharacterized protein n=1 Tax=Pichia inconspicua TaxID=52247 RepID=A0A4T0X3E8_9ASCO|nr:hypothetical protein CANINC_001514 [[Candida] inconspicua]